MALGASADSQLSYDELEAMTKRSHRAMQYVVHDMRAMGLIEVRSGAEDRRRRIIRLSTAGMRLYREYCDLVLSEMAKFTSDLAAQHPAANGGEQSANLGGAVPVPETGTVIKIDRERI
ncbi:MAG: MarR family winged helix-turn-helix transcriptional regulator [Alphaproteobacteria bacterium]